MKGLFLTACPYLLVYHLDLVSFALPLYTLSKTQNIDHSDAMTCCSCLHKVQVGNMEEP